MKKIFIFTMLIISQQSLAGEIAKRCSDSLIMDFYKNLNISIEDVVKIKNKEGNIGRVANIRMGASMAYENMAQDLLKLACEKKEQAILSIEEND